MPSEFQIPAPQPFGPILFLRRFDQDTIELAAIFLRSDQDSPPKVLAAGKSISPERIHRRLNSSVWRYQMRLPASGGEYSVDGEVIHVAGVTSPQNDMRLAYVSCNGQEHGDRERDESERNVMWARLAHQHQSAPLNLLLQGGDQIYADELTNVDKRLVAWRSEADTSPIAAEDEAMIGEKIRDYLLSAYSRIYNYSSPAWLFARVPSLCMWDDHDICDGWGSLSTEQLDHPLGKQVFAAAREFFLMMQTGCMADERLPICLNETGLPLGWSVHLPGVTLLAPDLRSERRPDQILGDAGWNSLESSLAQLDTQRVFLLSSVPLLGPRLSWIESVMGWLPGVQKYEDDLRDQWQSRAHREQWKRILELLLAVHRTHHEVTVLSGEIHLAARGTMEVGHHPIHQLIASGITHPPPPRAYSRALSFFAKLGEAPIPKHPITLSSLPGRHSTYTAQRNYLLLERASEHWVAKWDLERTGLTPALEL